MHLMLPSCVHVSFAGASAVFGKRPAVPFVTFGVVAVTFTVVAACTIAYALLLRG